MLSIIVTQQENLKGKIIFAYLQRGLSGSLFLSDKKTASAFLRMPISLSGYFMLFIISLIPFLQENIGNYDRKYADAQPDR